MIKIDENCECKTRKDAYDVHKTTMWMITFAFLFIQFIFSLAAIIVVHPLPTLITDLLQPQKLLLEELNAKCYVVNPHKEKLNLNTTSSQKKCHCHCEHRKLHVKNEGNPICAEKHNLSNSIVCRKV